MLPERRRAVIAQTTICRAHPAFVQWCFARQCLPALWRNLAKEARRIADQVPADLLVRTAAFLLLNDSLSSFQIEGEEPPRDRIQRWGRVIAEAGRRPVERKELERLGSP